MGVAVAAAALCLAMPAHLEVVAGFDDPCRFCAGSRSVVVATRSDAVVPAPVTGTVTYVGTVGGAPWIVVRSAEFPAVRVTLGGVRAPDVAAGDAVVIGEPIGTTSTRLVVTLRDADTYRDPVAWIGGAVRSSAAGRPRSVAALVGQRPRPDSVGASIHHCAVPTSWSLRRAEP
jgi:hypothetical protein